MSYPLKIITPVLFALTLQTCVSYEPAVLVPAVTLSPETVSLGTEPDSSATVSFGLEAAVNESDSLFNVEVLPGVRVRDVVSNGAAESAGIVSGDVILSINGLNIDHPDTLTSLEQNGNPEEYSFQVQRNTTVFEATVLPQLLATGPAPVELYRIDPLATRAGYSSQLVSLDDTQLVAARVENLFPGSTLPDAGIGIGDLIIAVNGRYLNSAQDLVNRLNRDFELGDQISISRLSGNNIQDIDVRLWNPGRRISRISLGPVFRYESSLNPQSSSVTLLDLWLFSLYNYQQQEGERSHSILGLINLSSDYGELIEENNE